MRQPARVPFRGRLLRDRAAGEKEMKLTTKRSRRAVGSVVLAAVLATAASAQSPSWPTPPAPAQQATGPAKPQAQTSSPVTTARLGQLLAPIALYPDELLPDVLMAASYPLDVVEAAYWLRDPRNAALKGDQLFAALRQKPWDPSVKSLAPFPEILRMLDANLEWTEQLGEAYLTDPAAVINEVQRLRRLAQLAGRVLMRPLEIAPTDQEPTRIEEPITIEAYSPEVVFFPIYDPSFAYGPWPDPGYPPFIPVFAGAIIGGCEWISDQIAAPFWGWSVLNFRTGRIEISRNRLVLLDTGRGPDIDHPPGEEWRHDPGHRGNVPYRNAAVSALFGGRGTQRANFHSAFGGRGMSLSRSEGPFAAPLRQEWPLRQREGGRPLLGDERHWLEGVGARPQGTTVVQPGFGDVQPALEGVVPIGNGAPVGQSLNRKAERMLIERRLFGPAPPPVLASPMGGPRALRSFGGMGSTPSFGGSGSFRPLVGIGGQPFGGTGPGAIGAPLLSNGRP